MEGAEGQVFLPASIPYRNFCHWYCYNDFYHEVPGTASTQATHISYHVLGRMRDTDMYYFRLKEFIV